MFVSDGFEDVSESKLLAWRIFSCVGVDFGYGFVHDQVIATCNAFPSPLTFLFRRGESCSVASSVWCQTPNPSEVRRLGSDFEKNHGFVICFSCGQAAKPSQAHQRSQPCGRLNSASRLVYSDRRAQCAKRPG